MGCNMGGGLLVMTGQVKIAGYSQDDDNPARDCCRITPLALGFRAPDRALFRLGFGFKFGFDHGIT